jgi:nitrogen fixation protein NifX
MTGSPMSRDVALRIGLAVRLLPDTDPARLLRVLADAVGLPPTEASLAKLTLKTLKTAADGELSEIDTALLKEALSVLWGRSGQAADPAPALEPYVEGDMPGSIRVACGSNTGESLDGHFGSCARFLVYQVSPEETRLIDVRKVEADAPGGDKNASRASLIGDCQVLYVVSIGGPAAAKVVRAGVHPIKFPSGGSARERVQSLQSILAGTPPPWLAKIMGQSPEERVRFELEAEA